MPRPYRQLAEFYDAIFAPWRAPCDEARHTILQRILPKAGSACDLACGTGTTALELARSGISTCAVDNSPTMCRIARQKAKAAGLRVRVIQADMREFRLPEPVDLIVCESDALNHIPQRADLRRVMRSAYRALRPGGWFYFDVNNADGFRSYWVGSVCFELPGVFTAMRNGHSTDALTAWSDIDWFLRTGSTWRRFRERVQEVCWSGEEIRRALHDAGFTAIRAFDACRFYRNNSLIKRGCRTNWLARKPSA